MKIVEKGGTKLVDILHKSNPWAGANCHRDMCLLCTTKEEQGKKNSQDCRRRNCVYETSCLTCTERQDIKLEEKYGQEGKKRIDEEKKKEKRYLYIGETNRSVYERGKEHQMDIGACKTSSHMLRHLLDQHEDEEENWDKVRFGMRILKSTRSAFERQILESVTIQKSRNHHIMNSKAEYNRCSIPRLSTKLGEKDLEKWRIEDREETEKEATIEEKIRVRKKEKAKRRVEASRRMEKGQPAKKKRRKNPSQEEDPETDLGVDEREGKNKEETDEQDQQLPQTPKKKRKPERIERVKTPKRKRKNYDIKRYITCKKWREDEERQREEEKDVEGQPDESHHQQHHHHSGQEPQGAEKEVGQTGCTGLVEEGPKQHHRDTEGPEPGAAGQTREPVSCVTSMLVWMPSPIVWASEGGNCPRTKSNLAMTNPIYVEETEPVAKEDENDKESMGKPSQEREDNLMPEGHRERSENGGQQERADGILQPEKEKAQDQGHQEGAEDDHDQGHQEGAEDDHEGPEPGAAGQARDPVSCVTSKLAWMPSPIVWASGGGSCPRTQCSLAVTNPIFVEETEPVVEESEDTKESRRRTSQETENNLLHEKAQGEGHQEGKENENLMPENLLPGKAQDQGHKEGAEDQRPTWIKNADSTENERYQKFLDYCEERREELRLKTEEDNARFKEAKKKKDAWALLRLSVEILKERAAVWATRKVAEYERIKEDDKKDRLAVAKMKKKRYGIQKLSKEETMRLRIRKEERLEISKAKSNLWRHYRRGEEDLEIDEEEASAWKNLEEGILILEEEGEWIVKEEDVKTRLEMRQQTLQFMSKIEIQPEDSNHESQEVSKSSQEVRKVRKSEDSSSSSTQVRKKQEGLTTPESGGGNEDRRKRDREGEEECWLVGRVAGRGVVELAELKPINIQNHDNLKTRKKAKDTGIFIGKVQNNTDENTVKSLVKKFEVLSDGVKVSTATISSKNTMTSVLSIPDLFASPSKKIRLSKYRSQATKKLPAQSSPSRRTPARSTGAWWKKGSTPSRPPDISWSMPAIEGTPVVSGMSRWTPSSPRLGSRQSMPMGPPGRSSSSSSDPSSLPLAPTRVGSCKRASPPSPASSPVRERKETLEEEKAEVCQVIQVIQEVCQEVCREEEVCQEDKDKNQEDHSKSEPKCSSSSLAYLSGPRLQTWPETRAPSPPHAQSSLEPSSSSSSLQQSGAQHIFKGIVQGGLAGGAGVSPVHLTLCQPLLFQVGSAHSCRVLGQVTGGKTTDGRAKFLCEPTRDGYQKLMGIKPEKKI